MAHLLLEPIDWSPLERQDFRIAHANKQSSDIYLGDRPRFVLVIDAVIADASLRRGESVLDTYGL